MSDDLTQEAHGATDATEVPQTDAEATIEPETYSADYVRQLRAEAAERRLKAKKVDEANQRLVRSYAQADGRLVNAEELAFDESLLGEDGIVDREKVAAAVSELLLAKPYLATTRPSQVIAQGVRDDVPDTPGLLSLLRQRI